MRNILLLIFFFAIDSYGQTFISIKGKLIDSKAEEPIPYASIFLKGKSIGTTTNEDGAFLFHVPPAFHEDTLMITVIGYNPFKSTVRAMADRDNMIRLKQSATMLNEVTIRASEKVLTAKEIVKKAVAKIPENYPMKPFMMEGFFRDLQRENGKPVELLEAALRFRYKDYNRGYEDVEIVEVRRSHNRRHPINGKYDRHNSIVDLMEDNYVKHRFGPINVKGWKFELDSIISDDKHAIYKISGTTTPSESVVMYINADDFSFLKLELTKQMVNGEFYRRYLNVSASYGLQETFFRVIFEFQKFEDKLYLKYQREEDAFDVFDKATKEVILKQSFVKELFVNNVMHGNTNGTVLEKMNMNKSVEGQAKTFNAEFWKYYNAPLETSNTSKIIQELEQSEFDSGN